MVKIVDMNGRGMSSNPRIDLGYFYKGLTIILSHVGGIGENIINLKFSTVKS